MLSAARPTATDTAEIIERLKTKNEQLKTENEWLKAASSNVTAENERLKTKNEQLKTENDRLKAASSDVTAENERLKTETSAATAQKRAATTKLEALKAENKAEKRARKSVVLPEGRTWTNAEQYVFQPVAERLVFLVGEKLGRCEDASLVRLTPSGRSLILHRPDRGYVSVLGGSLLQFLKSVRDAVIAVEVNEADQKKLETTIQTNLKKLHMLAGKITEDMVSAALISHLRFNQTTNVLTLDKRSGILNLVGRQIATYDRATCTVALVDRNPDHHHVFRTTRVDCAWLEPELESSKQKRYDDFQSTKLNRWIIDPEARQYVLCATGVALFGGDTTRIKSCLLVIGKSDQGKTALLNALVAAGGWRKVLGGPAVNTSECYSFSGADPVSLGGKASVTARSGVLGIGDGLRLLAFNELVSGDVWTGIKTLANAEPPSITTKKPSGAVSVRSVSTPYALLSCNLETRPRPPQTDVKTKVAVVTPAMLGTFVDTDGNGQTTFMKQAINGSNDSVCLASRIAIVHLAESLLQFKPSLLLLPPKKETYASSHTDPVPIAGSDAARDAAGTEEARRGASR
jgi:hypothetical protein